MPTSPFVDCLYLSKAFPFDLGGYRSVDVDFRRTDPTEPPTRSTGRSPDRRGDDPSSVVTTGYCEASASLGPTPRR
ncbi:hypothetical protein [Natrarchaeobius chitinivorans]|uniref:Uncharacterized protein n=1 Tax=Natrarchaeobius chitinivorans TaxID=1679083 RepID=A0A3N6MLV6_NATCH|nr:hypothetical protein [Natrarchaeobius chitinivorans]RQG97021.1 hypothetical protein EA473_02770 [Natrarchaeobius chitinivorans]